jgi:hypothetical protein
VKIAAEAGGGDCEVVETLSPPQAASDAIT